MRAKIACLVITAIACTHAYAACEDKFAAGVGPRIEVKADLNKATFICYDFYAVMTSGVTRTALWSAEHLTAESVEEAHSIKRVDSFHPDENIPPDDRAELADYKHSGWDQGHNSPSGDQPTAESQYQSFSLANMVPQNPDNNRHLWQGVEISGRALAKYDGDIYEVTGPLFIGTRGRIGGRVEVPNYMWKAIYDPKRGAGVYVTRNAAGDAFSIISVADFILISGIDPFPALDSVTKQRVFNLPAPRPSGQKLDAGPVSEAALGLGGEVSSVDGPVTELGGETTGYARRSAEHIARHTAWQVVKHALY